MIQTERQVRDALSSLDFLEVGKLGETLVPRSVILGYNLIPTAALTGAAKRIAFKMNALMDLY